MSQQWPEQIFNLLHHRGTPDVWICFHVLVGNLYVFFGEMFIQVPCKFFFFFFGYPRHMVFPHHGSDPSCSCNLSCSCSNAGSLTHCAEDWTCIPALPKCHQSHCATVGAPLCPFLNQFFFCCCWVVWVLHILWILNPYQIHGLQIFSPILWVCVFTFMHKSLNDKVYSFVAFAVDVKWKSLANFKVMKIYPMFASKSFTVLSSYI